MDKYYLQKNPTEIRFSIDKKIFEHFGNASIKLGDYSIAHMIDVPAGWNEKFQCPDFDEIILMLRGKITASIENNKELDDKVISQGESLFVRAGTHVRYSNPFDKSAEYVSICIPAFSEERAKREK